MLPGAEQRCIKCGHCVAVCPQGALAHESMSPSDCPPISKEQELTPDQVRQMFMSRRSIRVYQDRAVPRATMTELIRLAGHAPAGHNNQFTQWLVIEDREELRRLAGLVVEWMRSVREEQPHLVHLLDLDVQIEAWERGEECIFREAPHLVVAHAPQALRTMDLLRTAVQPVFNISLSHLELAASCLGLGACWAGYFLVAAEYYPPINKALELPEGNVSYGAVMIGYPGIKYQRMPRRKDPVVLWR